MSNRTGSAATNHDHRWQKIQQVKRATMYCRRCWYVLDGLSANRCPECGRPFTPGNRRTYRTQPCWRWWLAMTMKSLALAAIVVIVTGGWVYMKVRTERAAMAALPQGVTIGTARWGPTPLGTWADKYDLPVPQVVIKVFFKTEMADDDDLEQVAKLPNLKWLYIDGPNVTDAALVHLYGLNKLDTLWLSGTSVRPAAVVDLKLALPKLTVHGP